MASTDAHARQQLLDALGDAADTLGTALAGLGEAYERLDEHAGDRLEETLFRPVRTAYGRARRTHTEFAERHGLPVRTFAAGTATHATGPRELIDRAVGDIRHADDGLAALQDSMMPVEYGDAPLRAGISETRELLGVLPGRARELIRGLGR
jgi:hypothetical protein